MGDEVTDYKKFAMPRPKAVEGALKGVVLRVDSFGNLITNFRAGDLPAAAIESGSVQLQIGTQAVSRLVDTFAKGNPGEAFAYIGSSGFLEIGVNRGSASKALNVGRGTAVLLAGG